MESKTDSDLSQLRRAVLNDPRNGELRYLLGAEMAHQHDYEGAVLEFSAAIALSPQLHAARFQLGLLHLTLAQPHHAIAVLAPLEDLGDNAALKQFKRGIEALIKDDFSNCLQHLQRGIELNQENPPLNRDMRMIVERVTATLDAQKAEPVTVPRTSEASADAVRTDFSLYGLTRH